MERPSFWGVFSETRDITIVVLALLLFVLTVIGGSIGFVVGTVYLSIFVYEFMRITLDAPVSLAYMASGSITIVAVVFVLNLCVFIKTFLKWALYVHNKNKKH